MPREIKKRGRRASKRAREDHEDISTSPKRRRTQHIGDEAPADYIALENGDSAEGPYENLNGRETRYYGMLDDQEHDYFKDADQVLELNEFHDADERSLFIANLHKEAEGKELKLACQQTGSRLLERLIQFSTPDQLKNLFDAFKGEYIHLMSHRFASHCCETLFRVSAPVVNDELVNGSVKEIVSEEVSTMEAKFLEVVHEIQDDLGYMMTEKFASHCLRMLLMVLGGKPVEDSQQRSLDMTQHKSLVAGKRKKNILVATHTPPTQHPHATSIVPQSFTDSLHYMINQIVSTLDTDSVRRFATHAVANPTLQLLLQVELTLFGKQRGVEDGSIMKKLLPDDPISSDSDSATFIDGIVFDPTGSHLLETIIHDAPGKTFKNLYKELFKPRLGILARHDTASYVVCRILERLSAQDLKDATKAIIPEVPTLAKRGRMNVFKTLAERLNVREVDTGPFADALKAAYPTDDSYFALSKLLELSSDLPDVPTSTIPDIQLHIVTTATQNAASVFVQALLKLSGPLSSMVFDSLTTLEFKYLRCIAHTSPLSPILQSALTANAATIIVRRKIITHLYGAIAEFSVSPSASHVVDAIEAGSRKDLAFVRERVAEELSESAQDIRDNKFGRKVWRNWNMDMYQRNREQWIQDTRKKVGNNGFQSFPGFLGEADISAREKGRGSLGRMKATVEETMNAAAQTGKNVHQVVHENVCEPIRMTGKTALDRARERYAQKQRSGQLGGMPSRIATNTQQRRSDSSGDGL